jgi:hypothetical protein
MREQLQMSPFQYDHALIARWETIAGLPDRVQRALQTLDQIPDVLRPEISALLHELLLVIAECEAAEKEIDGLVWWSEQQHSGRPRGTTIHRWRDRDFLLLARRAAIIEATGFWTRAEDLEQMHRGRNSEEWVEILCENRVLEELPPKYRDSALRILPLLRDESMRQKGERQPHALALWHAQFCLGSPTISPAKGKWYRPTSIARKLRDHRREQPWFWKQADEEVAV